MYSYLGQQLIESVIFQPRKSKKKSITFLTRLGIISDPIVKHCTVQPNEIDVDSVTFLYNRNSKSLSLGWKKPKGTVATYHASIKSCQPDCTPIPNDKDKNSTTPSVYWPTNIEIGHK